VIDPPGVSSLDKGVPGYVQHMSAADVGAAGWNVLREDLPFPVCVLLEGPLERNIDRLQRFADDAGALLSPHGKTSMSPPLFNRQLAQGCWALTLATCHQLQVARRHGVKRVLYANQLVGAAEVGYVCAELRRDPDFELYCLVDSAAGVRLLGERVVAAGPGRPLQVLLEGGFPGGRSGVRDLQTAIDVATAVREQAPNLALVGVEGFEGLLQYRPAERRAAAVRDFIRFLVAIAEELDGHDLFDRPDVLLSAGGSAFYDLVVEGLSRARLSRPTRLVLRSGAYLTHDHGIYADLLDDVHARGGCCAIDLEPALEVWGQVLSVPESKLAILSAGRRDFGQDAGNPVPTKHALRTTGAVRAVSDPKWRLAGVSDQHAHLEVPHGHGIEVGDLIALGPSHPCTTFDKWRAIYLVDERYDVVDVVRTWF
jgi:D-serine dehydratase